MVGEFNMKRILLTTLVVSSLLIGCGSNTTTNQAQNNSNIEAETDTEPTKIYNQEFPIGSKVMLRDKNNKNSDYVFTIYDFNEYTNKYRTSIYKDNNGNYSDNNWLSGDEIIKSEYETQLEWCEANIGRDNNLLTNKDLWDKYYDKNLEGYVYVEGKVLQESLTDIGFGIMNEVMVLESVNSDKTLLCEVIIIDDEELNYFRDKLKSGDTVRFYGTVADDGSWDRYTISLPGIFADKDLIIK